MAELLLRIKQIKKSYRTKDKLFEALKGVSFDIYKGEILCLLGVNGAGKTTLSSIIATLCPPTKGDIEFQHESIYTNLIRYRKALGFCPQKPNFEKMLTVKENLVFAGHYFGMPLKEIESRVSTLLKEFELTPYINSFPDILSGGYKQRLLIARALIHNPSLIILDEPTVGMDPHIRRQLWDQITALKKQGVTILLTTHYFDEVEVLADRVCIMHQGVPLLIENLRTLKDSHHNKPLEEIFISLIEQHN